VDAQSLESEVRRFGWYHTLDLGGGVVTPGMFDHRPAVDRYLLPPSLAGQRCLDVGTMDGFWAFEMEKRGAAEVVAIDEEDPEALDWPVAQRARREKILDETKQARFALASEALGSKVERIARSVYDLGPDLGQFDLVFCGDLLLHLKDPITAVERMRLVCRGSAIVCNPIKRFWLSGRRAMAELDGIDEFQWWVGNLRCLERLMLAAGFVRVEVGKPLAMPSTRGGPWKGTRGVVRAFV
jgi:tRNA (mo5U34)-methyltransferase